MALSALVVGRKPAGQHIRDQITSQPSLAPGLLRCRLQHGQRPPGIAIRLLGEKVEGSSGSRPGSASPSPALAVGQCAIEQDADVGGGQRLENVDPAAAQQRGGELEAGIFSGGADQGDDATLHVGKKGVLLGPVEAVDLVAEENRSPPQTVAPDLGFPDDFPDPGNSFGHRAEADEFALGVAGDEVGQGGLARARRSPENRAAHIAPPDRVAQRLAGGEEASCPTNSSSVRGRKRAARGSGGANSEGAETSLWREI